VNYGSVTVGAKKAETVILTNNQSTSLAISSITLGGADAGDFSEESTCGTRDIEPWDWLMMIFSVLVIVALALPDTFFA
jgi:hypothetical protein